MIEVAFIPAAVVLTASLIAAATDLWKFRVYNVLTLPLLATGLIYHGATGGASGLLMGLGGCLFGFAALIMFYAMGGMGAGDVKLMAAVGAWLGMPLTLYVFLASALAAGCYAVVLIVACGRIRETWLNLLIVWHRLAALGRHLGAEERAEAQVNQADRRRRVIPFAAMIALGLVALLVAAWAAGAP